MERRADPAASGVPPPRPGRPALAWGPINDATHISGGTIRRPHTAPCVIESATCSSVRCADEDGLLGELGRPRRPSGGISTSSSRVACSLLSGAHGKSERGWSARALSSLTMRLACSGCEKLRGRPLPEVARRVVQRALSALGAGPNELATVPAKFADFAMAVEANIHDSPNSAVGHRVDALLDAFQAMCPGGALSRCTESRLSVVLVVSLLAAAVGHDVLHPDASRQLSVGYSISLPSLESQCDTDHHGVKFLQQLAASSGLTTALCEKDRHHFQALLGVILKPLPPQQKKSKRCASLAREFAANLRGHCSI